MDRYPPISEHGLIGDLQTSALVCTDGTIDWYCCPRVDSPSVFASLLDADRGGFFRISPGTDQYVSRQLYFPGTAILITRFMTPDGVGEVVDFMPVEEGAATDRHRLVRLLRVVRGVFPYVAELQPRFDYARQPHKVQITDDGAVFESDDLVLTLHRAVPPNGTASGRATLEHVGDGLRIRGTMRAGEIGGAILESGTATPRAIAPEEMRDLFNDTAQYWRRWLDRCTYRGRWRETVLRSAMTLKLMTYAPSGALVAAPTAGLPEQVGGERNWDYRYTWIRDSSFSVYALLGLGYTDEAEAFVRWLTDRITEQAGAAYGPLKIK
jgi:GH15 family glucan-1,4-alpha-glucosidase